MQLLDQENVQKAFAGYYHDENFNEEMLNEKKKIFENAGKQTRVQSTLNANNRNDSSIDSQSAAEKESKFSNYQRGTSQLVSSSPQTASQEQHSRANKYRQGEFDGMSNSAKSGAMSSNIGSEKQS